MRETNSISNTCLLLIAFLLLSACNETFQPTQENDTTPFAIYGYLDASADTQWVRVQPLRKYLDEPLSAREMHVTLKHVESGETAVMQDSLFAVNEGVNAINVWTTMDIEPDQTYLLRSERLDGAASEVTVTTPPDFPTPVLTTTGTYHITGNLILADIERVVDILTVWQVDQEIYFIPYRHRLTDTAPSGYDYTVHLTAFRDVEIMFPLIKPTPEPGPLVRADGVQRMIFVASGGPEWNEEITSLSDLEYAIPESFYNVENGVGYVIGIVSKTIPFRPCVDEQGKIASCPEEDPFWK